MKQSLYRGLFACLSLAALASCQDYDAGFNEADIKKGLYAKDFEKTFGTIDPNQDWNAAGRFSASIDLTGISESSCDVLVYNGNPLGGGELAAHFVVNGQKDFQLDLPKANTHAYVVVADVDGGILLSDYIKIEDGILRVAKDATRANPVNPAPDITLREVEQTGVVAYNDLNTPLHPEKGEFDSNFPYDFSVYYLDADAAIKNGEAVNKAMDLATLVAKGTTYNVTTPAGFTFQLPYENGYFAEGVDNRTLYADKFEKDVILTTKGGEVTIANEFGGTDYTNQFGYYYYYEGSNATETLKNKIAAKKYVAIRRSEPGNNIVVRRESQSFVDEALEKFDSKNIGGMALPNQVIPNVLGKGSGWSDNDLVVGTKYRLIYFDDPAGYTYDFPEGLKIGFFYKTLSTGYIADQTSTTYVNGEKDGYNIRFSDNELNKYYGKMYDQGSNLGDWKAVTYTLKTVTEVVDLDGTKRIITTKKVVAGFEDGTDNDLNDILFHIDGVKVEEVPDIEIKSDKQAWVIASEDLGGSFDYDFNDVVFCVKHTSGENVAKIVPYASSGTLPVYVYYTDKDGASQKLGDAEFHSLVKAGAPSDKQINGNSREEGAEIEITVPSTFSLSYDAEGHSNMGGFDVKVDRSGNGTEEGSGANVITGKGPGKGKSPQMLLIHDINFAWPTEGTYIVDAYPLFANYVTNPSGYYSKWYEASVASYCVPRGSHSLILDGQEQGGNSGSGSGSGSTNPSYFVTPILTFTDVEISKGGNYGANLVFGSQSDGTATGTKAFGNYALVTMTSSNTAVATVDYNTGTGYYTINGLSIGDATIIVRHAEDKVAGYNASEATFKVSVVDSPESGLTLNITSVTLGVGSTAELTTSGFADGNNLTYESSDPSVAKVNNPTANGWTSKYIEAYKAGTATITVIDPATSTTRETRRTVIVKVLASPNITANNITLGCNKTLTLVRSVHYNSLSDGEITLSVDGSAATVNGTQITTGSVGYSTNVTVTINQAATSTYASGTCTFTLTVDPAAKDPATISLTGGEKNVTIAANENSAVFTINASDYSVGASTGAISFESSDPSVFTLSKEDDVLTLTRVTKNDKVAYVKIVQGADADHSAGFVNYVKVTVEGLPTENVVGKTKVIDCVVAKSGSPMYYRISLEGLGTGGQDVTADISITNPFYVNGYCLNSDGSNPSASTTTLSKDFMSAAFENGCFYVYTYNNNGVAEPKATIKFIAE